MKNINLKKRKDNMLIATIVTVSFFILNALLFLGIRLLKISLIPKIILFAILLVYTIFILPRFLLKIQDLMYNYLCKNIDIIEKNLSSNYVPIFLNTNVIKDSALILHAHRKYFARLDNDGAIIIKIENDDCNRGFIEKTYDYSLFLSLFRFKN